MEYKIWNYKVHTVGMRGSFDHGIVEARTELEATTKAKERIIYDLSKVNECLNHCDNTSGMSIEMDLNELDVELAEIL